MSGDSKPTKKQIENCRWLFERYGTDVFPSNAFMNRYERDWLERKRREYVDAGYEFGPHSGTNRRHGWRRASGTVLMKMRKAGLVEYSHVPGTYSFSYALTEAGIRLAQEGTR